jgi:hypothetical protein
LIIVNKKNIAKIIFAVIGLVIFKSCSELPEGVAVNQHPETYLSLFPDSVISPQKTKINISWWGDDPDGLIKEFRFSFDSVNWTSTTKNDSTFQLVISGNDSTFRFWVAAVDDKGAVDPTPATNLYPVINSPPSVSFNPGTEIPDTSFPVASFKWTGTDPDGDNTIKFYYWSLNDTINWHSVSQITTLITLRESDGIVPNSNNVLYLRAEDIAGTFSTIKRMPDTNKTWFVRPKTGNILLLNDYTRGTDINQAVQFYKGALDSAFNNNYSYLDIKAGSGANIPRIINPMFIETLKLFQCVIWFANRGIGPNDNANFDLAQQTLPFYVVSGGKLLVSTGFPDNISSQGNIINFAPVDSMTNFVITNIDPGTQTIVIDNNYPVLTVGGVLPDRVRGIKYRTGTPLIYKFPYSTPYDTSRITIAIKDALSGPKVFFLSVPLNRMTGDDNATYFLRRVLSIDFGLN